MDILWCLLPFVIAFILTGLELITSKYPSTAQLVFSSWAFWALCFCYGIIAIIGFCVFKFHLVAFGGMPDNDFIEGLVSGFFSRAIVQLNLFTITIGSQNLPVGLKTFVQIFEPYFLRVIALREYNEVSKILLPIQMKYQNWPTVDAMINANIPSTLSDDAKMAFVSSIKTIHQQQNVPDAAKIQQALEDYFRFAGKETLKRVFP